MVETAGPMLDAPIAGQSLTAEVGNRPWQQPPQYTTVEEALEYYIPRITNPTMLENLFDVMESGIPLTTIANAIQTAGAMEGKHTLDVGILIMPVLIETMAYLAEEADVEYDEGSTTDMRKDKPSDAAVARAINMVRKEQGEETNQETMPEENVDTLDMEAEQPMGGLMSRRVTDGV
jgi:hypothetical protein